MSTASPVRTASRAAPRPRGRTRGAAVLAAAAAAAAGWAITVPVAGVALEVDMGGQTQAVGLGSVVAVSLAAGGLGWALLTVLERLTRRAVSVWTGIAVAVAAVSLVGPVTSASSAAAAAVLAGLHLVVAEVLVPPMRRSARGRTA